MKEQPGRSVTKANDQPSYSKVSGLGVLPLLAAGCGGW